MQETINITILGKKDLIPFLITVQPKSNYNRIKLLLNSIKDKLTFIIDGFDGYIQNGIRARLK